MTYLRSNRTQNQVPARECWFESDRGHHHSVQVDHTVQLGCSFSLTRLTRHAGCDDALWRTMRGGSRGPVEPGNLQDGPAIPRGTSNHGRRTAINRVSACPKLPANRSLREHRKSDAIDPKWTSRATFSVTLSAPAGSVDGAFNAVSAGIVANCGRFTAHCGKIHQGSADRRGAGGDSDVAYTPD